MEGEALEIVMDSDDGLALVLEPDQGEAGSGDEADSGEALVGVFQADGLADREEIHLADTPGAAGKTLRLTRATAGKSRRVPSERSEVGYNKSRQRFATCFCILG